MRSWLGSIASRFVTILLVPLFALTTAVLATGQDLAGIEQGIKPYGAYHGGDIDSISMVNGNLTLHIPLVSYPQRGGKLHLGVSVNCANPVYTLTFTPLTNPGHYCSIYGCYVWGLGYGQGIQGQGVAGQAIKIDSDLPTVGEVWNCKVSPCIVRNYNVKEPDGAVHQMGTTASNWISMDTTGYVYDATHLVLTDRRGTRYMYNGSRYPGALTEVEDVNGNVITSNLDPNNSASVLSYNDTMGRITNLAQQSVSTSACPSGNGLLPATSAVAWNFPGPNGSTTAFTVCGADRWAESKASEQEISR